MRKKFVRDLIVKFNSGKEIWYLDETTVNLWTRRVKTWMHKSKPIKFQLAEDRGSSITVNGAISSKGGKLVY